MDKVQAIFQFLMSVMDRAIAVLISLAVLAVLWGILTYFFKYSPEKRKEANAFIIYGLLSLFVITSLWGFVSLFGSVLGINVNGQNTTIDDGTNYDDIDRYDDETNSVNFDSDLPEANEDDYGLIIPDDYEREAGDDYDYVDISDDI